MTLDTSTILAILAAIASLLVTGWGLLDYLNKRFEAVRSEIAAVRADCVHREELTKIEAMLGKLTERIDTLINNLLNRSHGAD